MSWSVWQHIDVVQSVNDVQAQVGSGNRISRRRVQQVPGLIKVTNLIVYFLIRNWDLYKVKENEGKKKNSRE